jgi:hypothetical protein
LPEMRELVAQVERMVSHFHRIVTDAPGWIEANGLLPSRLVAIKRHPLLRREGDKGQFQIPDYDCCLANRWRPMEACVVHPS